MFSLRGKTVLVTGASSGIGKQICITLAGQGAQLIITGRSTERLSETLQALAGEGHQMIPADLTDSALLAELVKGLPVLTGVVFCAGVITYLPAAFSNEAKIAEIFKVNYNSQIVLCQQILKAKKIAKGGALVFISSISSQLGVPGTLLYASSKAAVNAAVKVLAAELSSQKIRVNAIAPGIVRTPLLDTAKDIMEKERFDNAEKEYPLGYGEPADVANATVFYLADESKWATGNIMILDGGYTLK
ncbi:NAD(P)-dependent dehydrogenase, short-chain alcohol dehydrogenase family [Chitinophaga jiangningensis]|uniref:NAD(P)-dependent dehydrogenase, short-chain alcohol dehydrogenase family n=1 Tax=Chitinophaga jiangningensis TaxID=1419482 RepID=A0A1M7HIQ6_9BACT|nr:SDR family oxidoreductase [Chitinophaga jiangningensis]SHM28375.1 NAD(P)-dependent dehydrogenase, short-chain alcohol dehydrogenase family [Chitinophaga jiangningensis]